MVPYPKDFKFKSIIAFISMDVVELKLELAVHLSSKNSSLKSVTCEGRIGSLVKSKSSGWVTVFLSGQLQWVAGVSL